MKRTPPCECERPLFGQVKDCRRWKSGTVIRRRVCGICGKRIRTYELTNVMFNEVLKKVAEVFGELPTEERLGVGYWLRELGDSRA